MDFILDNLNNSQEETDIKHSVRCLVENVEPNVRIETLLNILRTGLNANERVEENC